MLKNLYILMAVLVFSMPFTTLAQQHTQSVQERSVAESDAKRDSQHDVNETRWFIGGFVGHGAGALITLVGAILALKGHYIHHEEASCASAVGATLHTAGVCLMFGGPAVTSFVPLVAVSLSPTPQPDRLLGKSPAYIDTYVSTYKRSVRMRRGAFSSIGCLSGVLFSVQLFYSYF